MTGGIADLLKGLAERMQLAPKHVAPGAGQVVGPNVKDVNEYKGGLMRDGSRYSTESEMNDFWENQNAGHWRR